MEDLGPFGALRTARKGDSPVSVCSPNCTRGRNVQQEYRKDPRCPNRAPHPVYTKDGDKAVGKDLRDRASESSESNGSLHLQFRSEV